MWKIGKKSGYIPIQGWLWIKQQQLGYILESGWGFTLIKKNCPLQLSEIRSWFLLSMTNIYVHIHTHASILTVCMIECIQNFLFIYLVIQKHTRVHCKQILEAYTWNVFIPMLNKQRLLFLSRVSRFFPTVHCTH